MGHSRGWEWILPAWTADRPLPGLRMGGVTLTLYGPISELAAALRTLAARFVAQLSPAAVDVLALLCRNAPQLTYEDLQAQAQAQLGISRARSARMGHSRCELQWLRLSWPWSVGLAIPLSIRSLRRCRLGCNQPDRGPDAACVDAPRHHQADGCCLTSDPCAYAQNSSVACWS